MYCSGDRTWLTGGAQSCRSGCVSPIATSLDRFQWLVLDDLAEASHQFLYRDRRQGNKQVIAFIAAQERHQGRYPRRTGGVPLADQIIRERDKQAHAR